MSESEVAARVKIGFLIPEFPGQTHAFFIRERNELTSLGVDTNLISTRAPIAAGSMAQHEWAEAAVKETTYLFPLKGGDYVHAFLSILFAGPMAWFKCLGVVFGPSDLRLKERTKMFAMMLAGAFLKRHCRSRSITHVHVHSCANSANVAMFARFLGGPSYSLTLHGPMQDYGTNQAKKWSNAAYCIIITQELIDEVHQLLAGVKLPPLYLAPMGVRVKEFKRTSAYQPPQSGETIRLVSCGRLNFVKAHDDLIRAVAQLREQGAKAQLNICGAADSLSDVGSYFKELKQLRLELNLDEAVNFLGSVSEQRVKEELESAHFFCLASLKEPLGVATMEAMAMELPAIVARSPGVCEMVDHDVDGVLVNPRAPEQFVEQILRLVDDPAKCISLATKGRQKIVERFHSGVSASKIAEGFQSYGDK